VRNRRWRNVTAGRIIDAMTKVLMILSAADRLTLADGAEHPTGFWAEEVATPFARLTDAGVQVDVATPGGRVPVPDALSLADGRPAALDAGPLADALAAPLTLAGIDPTNYDAFLLPGGHAPMADLTDDAALGALLVAADAAQAPVAALCHGVAGLLSARTPDGRFAFAGRALTAFSDAEEHAGGLGDRSPWLLETRLREAGAHVRTGAPWSSEVVVDGTLVTGQNPQSSAATAEALLRVLDGAGRVEETLA
jgi:putative intracellular protease/amidase